MSVVAYNGDTHLFGWYLGFIIGSVIITVIVAEVAAVLSVAYDHTYALRDLTRTRDIAQSVTENLYRTRRALER